MPSNSNDSLDCRMEVEAMIDKDLNPTTKDQGHTIPVMNHTIPDMNRTKIDRNPTIIDKEPEPPDGGWGWMIVIGTILIMFTSQMISPSFGIMFSGLLRSLNVSSLTVAWIYNTQGIVWNISQLFAGPLCEVFSWRSVAMFGALIAALSVIISAFATSAAFLFFSFSFMGGFGPGMSVAVCFFIIPRYFKKYRETAIAVMMCGSCVGQFLCPLLVSYLQESYGFLGATLLIGGVVLHSIIGASLFRPLRPAKRLKLSAEHESKKCSKSCSEDEEMPLQGKKDLEDFELGETTKHQPIFYKILCRKATELVTTVGQLTMRNVGMIRSLRAVIIAVGISTYFIGYLNYNMMVAFSVQNDGYSLEDAAWCTSAFAIGNMTARVLLLLFSNWSKLDRKLCYTFGMLFQIIASLGFTFVSTLPLYLSCMCLFGIGTGLVICLYPSIIIEVMGINLYTQTFGFVSLVIATSCVIIGPLAGFVRDYTGSYKTSMRMISGIFVAAFVLWLFMPFAVQYDAKRELRVNQEDKICKSPNEFKQDSIKSQNV